MTLIIASAGKGSAGKTTMMHGLFTRLIQRAGITGLAVDVDPTGLWTTIAKHEGILPETIQTVGAIRSDYERQQGALADSDAPRVESAMVNQAICKFSESWSWLSLGRWELPGSQCTPNRALSYGLQEMVDKRRYDIILCDEEAGIEHIGRYANLPIDIFFVVLAGKDVFWTTATKEVILTIASHAHARSTKRDPMIVLIGNRWTGDDEEWKHWSSQLITDVLRACPQDRPTLWTYPVPLPEGCNEQWNTIIDTLANSIEICARFLSQTNPLVTRFLFHRFMQLLAAGAFQAYPDQKEEQTRPS